METMQITPSADDRAPVRVMLVGAANGANIAVAGWLREQTRATVVGPVPPRVNIATLEAVYHPHFVVVDVDQPIASLAQRIAALTTLKPAPTIVVLTCDDSDALRRHCRALGAEFVFPKASGLDQLAALLNAACDSTVGAEVHLPR
jgi:DNA-binding NarL/FixJ family response regulator